MSTKNFPSQTWYAYVQNNPVNFRDLFGLECQTGSDKDDAVNNNVSFVIYRTQESRESYINPDKRGTDTIVFTNNISGEKFYLPNSQTTVSYFANNKPVYKESDTLMAYQGNVSLQYLGDNKKIGQSLFGGETSNYYGPVFNVVNSLTENGTRTDKNGIASFGEDPYRMHSNLNLSKGVKPLASAGCPMYEYQRADAFADFLEDAGVIPGDIINGYIYEDMPR